MAKRRNLEIQTLNRDKFIIFVRFMIVAAEKKRFVEYNELTKILGIPLEDLRDYAGFLGDYCSSKGFPYLNSLIINSSDGMPGDDFFTWADDNKSSWGDYVAQCFKGFHLTMPNRYKNTSGINNSIIDFLDN